jgi:ribosomal subunit interface protein
MLRTEISGVHAPVDDKLKRYIRHKIGGLDRYVPRRARRSSHVEIRLKEVATKGDSTRNHCTCDVVLHVPHDVIAVSETTVNMYAAVDIVEEKLKHRLRKYKETHSPAKLRQRVINRMRRRGLLDPSVPVIEEASAEI